MRTITQEEFNRLEQDQNGIILCPSGDYTKIKSFPQRCIFSAHCRFGSETSFGEFCCFNFDCVFGNASIFSEFCNFGHSCSFGKMCVFGSSCNFGFDCFFSNGCNFASKCSFCENCYFDENCTFGCMCNFADACYFEDYCCFGGWCDYSEDCKFGDHTSHEHLTNSTYFACDRIGSQRRKTYFFKSDEGYFVRAGCFFGTFDEFVKKVHETHGGTRYEREYLAAVELAKVILE